MPERTGYHKLTAGLFVIGAILGLYFQFAYHKFLNNDTLSYINIAERYAEGDWQHAINGFWSPMYSWILLFCKLAGLPFLQSCYVINFIAAAGGLYVLCRLAGRYLTQPLFYFAFSLYALLLMLFYAMSTLTPDLLAAVLCLWFLYLVTDHRFTSNKKMPWAAGVIAAGACFSKMYSLVPVHLFLAGWILLLLLQKKSGSKQFIPLIKTYSLFFVLTSIWIAILSIHEHQLVVTTAGRFNHNFMNPAWGKSYPTEEGLYAPPYEKAYSAQTDPAHLLDNYGWSPFSSTHNFLYQLKLVQHAVFSLCYFLDTTGAKWLILIASFLILFLNSKKKELVYDRNIHKIAWFFVCYPLLYLPLFVLDRYILTCIILFHLLLFFITQLAWGVINKKIFGPVIVVLLLVSLIPFFKQGQLKLTYSSSEYRYYKSFYEQIPQLSFLQGQSIATDPYAMVEATQLCYYFRCRNYSTWKDNRYQSLKQFNIHYLVAKQDLTANSFLRVVKKLSMENETLYIYEIR